MDPFCSSRLLYRAIEPTDDAYFIALSQDYISSMQARTALPKPYSKAQCQQYMNDVVDKNLLAVVICLRPTAIPDSAAEVPASASCPIGNISMSRPRDDEHHRNGMISIKISNTHQGKGE